RDTEDLDAGRIELACLQPLLHVPQAQRVIGAARNREAAVRPQGQASDAVRMPDEPAQLLTRVQVPQPQRAVATGGQGAAAVRQEGHGTDRVAVAVETEQFLPGG